MGAVRSGTQGNFILHCRDCRLDRLPSPLPGYRSRVLSVEQRNCGGKGGQGMPGKLMLCEAGKQKDHRAATEYSSSQPKSHSH